MNCKSGVTMLLAGFSQWRHALSQLGFACSFCRCAMNKADTLGTYCIEVCVMNKMRMHSFFFSPFCVYFVVFFVCVFPPCGGHRSASLFRLQRRYGREWKSACLSALFPSVPCLPVLPPHPALLPQSVLFHSLMVAYSPIANAILHLWWINLFIQIGKLR